MKLSRALLERRDQTKKIARVKEEILSILVTDSESPVDKIAIDEQFSLFNQKMNKLHELNKQIDSANAEHMLSMLSTLRILDSKIDFYKACRSKLISDSEMRYYSRNDRVEIKNISVDSVTSSLEELEEERKNLDSDIQEKNWTIEV